MTTNTTIQVTGLKEAIRSLNKVEPGLRKQFTADATRIAQPAIQEVQNSYDKVPLSGMARKWEQANKKIFPFSVAKAKSGVKLKVDASREATSLIYITQTNVAAAVFEAAGRANQNRLGDSLGQLRPNHTRILGPAVFRKRKEIEREMLQASKEAMRLVQRELD
jgi:predicted phage tail protein